MKCTDCWYIFRIIGREKVDIYLFIVPLRVVEVFPRLQVPSLPTSVQEPTLHVLFLLPNMLFLANFMFSTSLERGCNFVITYNSMALCKC